MINIWLGYEPPESGNWIHAKTVEEFVEHLSTLETERVCIHCEINPDQFGGRIDGNLNGLDAVNWILSSNIYPRIIFLRSVPKRDEMVKLLTNKGPYKNAGITSLHKRYVVMLHIPQD